MDLSKQRLQQRSSRRWARASRIAAPEQRHAVSRPGPHHGEKVSLLGIGGAHIGEKRVPEDVGIRIMRTAIDEGANFMDNCWDYNGGESEKRMGEALRDGYRDKAFPHDEDRRPRREDGCRADR